MLLLNYNTLSYLKLAFMRMEKDGKGKDRNISRRDLGHFLSNFTEDNLCCLEDISKRKSTFSKVVLKSLKNIMQILINFRKSNFRKSREGNLLEKYKSDNF